MKAYGKIAVGFNGIGTWTIYKNAQNPLYITPLFQIQTSSKEAHAIAAIINASKRFDLNKINRLMFNLRYSH